MMLGRPDYQLGVWLGKHPWAMWLIALVGIGCFVAWLAAPVTWQNGEGSIVDDGKKFADSLRRADNPLRWLWGAAKNLNERKK